MEEGVRVTVTTSWVNSPDGTEVGFERVGDGPPLVAIHGGTADRTRWDPVRAELAKSFTLHLVDRRGRGLSARETDGPYSIEREGEDIAAVVEAAGVPALVVGHSYGGLVAMEAALISPLVAGLVLYEPAAATPGHVPVADDVFDRFETFLSAGRREDALTLFFAEVAGLPTEQIDAMRGSAIWEARLATIHTSPREGRSANSYSLDPARLAGIRVPATILVGTESPAWLRAASDAAHVALPGSRLVALDGQGHMAIDTAPARVVDEILQAGKAAFSD